jgi:hypothetical protein
MTQHPADSERAKTFNLFRKLASRVARSIDNDYKFGVLDVKQIRG